MSVPAQIITQWQRKQAIDRIIGSLDIVDDIRNTPVRVRLHVRIEYILQRALLTLYLGRHHGFRADTHWHKQGTMGDQRWNALQFCNPRVCWTNKRIISSSVMTAGRGGSGEGRNDWYAISPCSCDVNDPALFPMARLLSPVH